MMPYHTWPVKLAPSLMRTPPRLRFAGAVVVVVSEEGIDLLAAERESRS